MVITLFVTTNEKGTPVTVNSSQTTAFVTWRGAIEARQSYIYSGDMLLIVVIIFRIIGERILCFHGPLLYEAKVSHWCSS